jgi:hypothetical protein
MSDFLQHLHGRKPALAALFCILALLAASVTMPVYAGFAAQIADRDAMLQRLAIYRAEIDARPRLQAELKTIRGQAQSASSLIKSDSAALAAAQMQNDIKAIVAANKGEIRSTQIVPVVKTGGFETIAVAYDFLVPVSHLRALTYAIEADTPYLFLDAIDMVAPQNSQTTSAPGVSPELEIRWTIRGYRWAGVR